MTAFRKIQISNFITSFQWKPSCCIRTNEQTDVMKAIIITFRNFSKALRTEPSYLPRKYLVHAEFSKDWLLIQSYYCQTSTPNVEAIHLYECAFMKYSIQDFDGLLLNHQLITSRRFLQHYKQIRGRVSRIHN